MINLHKKKKKSIGQSLRDMKIHTGKAGITIYMDHI